MFPRTLRALAFRLFTLLLLCWAGGAWAQTSGTMSFSSGDGDLDYSQLTITRSVGGQLFSLSGGSGAGGLAFDGGGIYAFEGPASEVELTITAPAGYLFNLNSLQAQAQLGDFRIDYTQADGSTGNTMVTGVTTGSLSSRDVNLANLTQVVLNSTDYAVFNNLSFSNIKLIPAPPTVTTDAASAITSSGATFNGTVNAEGDSTVVSFQYGITTGYGSTITAAQSPLSSSSATAVTAAPTLSCNTTYHYRVVAANAAGTSTGGDMSFTTSVCPPTVTSLSPSSGPVAGGNSVVLTGTNFTGATAVAFGATPAAGFTVDSATQITATAPAGTAGNVFVTVTTAGGTSVTAAGNQYSYVALPVVSSVSPALGTTAGGTSVTITGTGFTGASAVSFGATPATSYTVDSATQITATAPAGAQGTIDVTVTTVGGSSATGASTRFTYAAAPTATTGVASSITATGATIAGTASDNGAETTLSFEYGQTISYGSTATATPGTLSAGAGSTAVSGSLSGLTCNTPYHFRLKAVNGVATTNGLDASFTTAACPPSATTNAASALTATAATLNATVNDNGAATNVGFEWGTSTSYGNLASASPATVNAGAGSTPVTGNLTGLSCNTVYHYRVSTTSSAGTTLGSDVSFTTGACVPGAPTGVVATADVASASVAFTAPADNGGAAITSYTVTSDPGNITGTCASSPCTVTGLTNGTAYTFTVRATNSAGTGSASVASNSVTPRAAQTITFNNPGAQNFGTTPTLTASSDSGLTPTFTSSTTGACTITSGGLLSFVTAGTCTINADQAGNASYLPATQVSRSFAVNPVAPGAPTGVSATAGNTQATVSFTAPISNGGAAISSYTVTSSPGGFTGTGTASPISVSGLTNGVSYTFTVQASNVAGDSGASAASNGVVPIDAPPVASAVSATVAYGSSGNAITLILSGGTATSVAVASAPGNGTATVSGTSISYTPNAGYFGTDTFTYTATNAGGTSAPATVTITVIPQAPVAGSVSTIVAYGSSGNVITLNLGGGAAASVAIASAPANGTATASGTSISYTPNAGYSGSDTFTYTATNAGGTSAAATVTITVSPQLPVAGAVTATVAFGSSGNAIALNLSGGAATSVAVASAPAHGTATASGTSIAYTPTAGFSGSDTFTYTVTGAGGTSAPATVTITVNPQAPVAGNVSLTVDVNSTNNVVPLSLSGGAAASVAVATAPSHGVATVSGTSITYTPTAGYIGADSFTYTATNATATSAPGTVTLLVQSRPDPTKDAEVTGLINAQVEVANRFAQAQISNFQSHLEGMHRRSREAGSATSSFATRAGAADPWGDAADDPSAASSPTGSSRVIGGKPYLGKRVAQSGQNGAVSGNASSGRMGTISSSTGLDEFVLPQTKTTTDSASLSSLLPWSFTSLNLGGKHGDVLGNGLEVWTAGVVSIGKTSDTDTRFTTSGISIGADQRIDEGLMIGVGAGFGHERQKIGDNGTKNDGDGYSFVVYGSYQPTEAIFLDGLLGYGSLDFDSDRYVTALGSKAGSSRRGAQWFASLSGGYDFIEGKSLLSTYGRLDWVSTRLNETTEKDGGIYSLTYFEQNTSTTKLSVGLRGETQLEWSNGSAKPYFRIEYQHNLDTPGSAEMAYADQLFKVYEFDIEGVDRNTLVLGLGGDVLLKKDWNLGLGYRYSYGSESTRMHALRFELKKAF